MRDDNGVHFYTTTQHIVYMKEVEKLNDVEVAHNLRKYWNCQNLEIGYMLDMYYKNKE